jgi:histidine triad (HIT) family protein
MSKPDPACVFCRILAGEAPAKVIYEDEQVIAIRDIHPIAPLHVLVIPRRHIPSVNELEPGDEGLVGHMVLVAGELARREGVAGRGYRLLLNTGRESGQTVYHLHLHLISGKLTRFVMG